MQLISVNIGGARPIANAKPVGKTGIYKLPASGLVQISAQGLAGDTICDTKSHGGVDQAVYVYGGLDYAWWSGALGREVPPGTFGDNLTISELESARFSVGDRLRVGTAILEVTAPRYPCVTLATRMEDPGFVKRFRQAERPGLYCRVLQPGWVQAGDEVIWERFDRESITILEMFRDHYEPERATETHRRYLAAPISVRERLKREDQLQQLLAADAKGEV